MGIKLFGAALVVIGCAAFGYLVAYSVKRECSTLRQLITALEFMICELNYRRSPLPELFRLTSSVCSGVLCKVFIAIADELDKQISHNASLCIGIGLKKNPDIPKATASCLMQLGQSIGSFDLSGQLNCVESVKAEATRLLNASSENQANKLRCYKTLGLSAGAALVIIFI